MRVSSLRARSLDGVEKMRLFHAWIVRLTFSRAVLSRGEGGTTEPAASSRQKDVASKTSVVKASAFRRLSAVEYLKCPNCGCSIRLAEIRFTRVHRCEFCLSYIAEPGYGSRGIREGEYV